MCSDPTALSAGGPVQCPDPGPPPCAWVPGILCQASCVPVPWAASSAQQASGASYHGLWSHSPSAWSECLVPGPPCQCLRSLAHSLHSPLSTLGSPLAAFALLSPPSGHGPCTAGPTNPTCDEPGCKGWGVKCHKACPEVGCGHFNHIMQKRCQVCDADRGTTPRSPRSPRWVTYGERESKRECVCERERTREGERESVCVYICMCLRERERETVTHKP